MKTQGNDTAELKDMMTGFPEQGVNCTVKMIICGIRYTIIAIA